MNYETDIQNRSNAGKDIATIAAEINTERRQLTSNYRPVKSTEVTDWMASGGRQSRIDKALNAFTENPAYDTFASAWDGLKALRSNTNAVVLVAPGQEHRQLIVGAIAAGLMTQSDLDALDAIVYQGRTATEQEVADEVARYESVAAQLGRLKQLGVAYLADNPEATLQQVFDAVKDDV
jgi:hypothetical protein